jgi:predicted nucleic acid-binding protein
MVVVLDTNHFTEFSQATLLGKKLLSRIKRTRAEVFSCIVAAEESLQGWLAFVRSRSNGIDQLEPYARLHTCIETLSKLTILPFDDSAAVTFHRLQKQHRRIGPMDLKITSICLAYDAVLLSRNLKDFESIVDLRVENWLD